MSVNKKTLKKYATLHRNIKELESEIDGLKLVIIESFQNDNIKKQDTAYGTFTLSARATYKYSARVEALVTTTKLLQIEEQEKGIAIKLATPFVLFSNKK